MRKKLKKVQTKIKGFGSRANNKANGGESLADCEFLSVAPNFCLAIDSRSKLHGWGENISGVLNFDQLGLSNKKFESVSAGSAHAVGLYSYNSFLPGGTPIGGGDSSDDVNGDPDCGLVDDFPNNIQIASSISNIDINPSNGKVIVGSGYESGPIRIFDMSSKSIQEINLPGTRVLYYDNYNKIISCDTFGKKIYFLTSSGSVLGSIDLESVPGAPFEPQPTEVIINHLRGKAYVKIGPTPTDKIACINLTTMSVDQIITSPIKVGEFCFNSNFTRIYASATLIGASEIAVINLSSTTGLFSSSSIISLPSLRSDTPLKYSSTGDRLYYIDGDYKLNYLSVNAGNSITNLNVFIKGSSVDFSLNPDSTFLYAYCTVDSGSSAIIKKISLLSSPGTEVYTLSGTPLSSRGSPLSVLWSAYGVFLGSTSSLLLLKECLGDLSREEFCEKVFFADTSSVKQQISRTINFSRSTIEPIDLVVNFLPRAEGFGSSSLKIFVNGVISYEALCTNQRVSNLIVTAPSGTFNVKYEIVSDCNAGISQPFAVSWDIRCGGGGGNVFSPPSYTPISSNLVNFNFVYNSPNGKFDFSRSHTGNWNSPLWFPESQSDPFDGFLKNVVVTGVFDAGVIIKKYPSEEVLFDEKYLTTGYFSGNFNLLKNESFSLEIWPRPRVILPDTNNAWSSRAFANVSKIEESFIQLTGWGSNFSNQLGFLNDFSQMKEPAYAFAGNDLSLILFKDGTVTGYGYNNSGQLSNLNTLTNIIDVSAGTDHSLFLDKNGNIFSRGSNSHGQCNLSNISKASLVSAGGNKSIVLYENPQNPELKSVFATGEAAPSDLAFINRIQNAAYANAGVQGFIIVLNDGTVLRIGEELCSGLSNGLSSVRNAVYAFDGLNHSQVLLNNGVSGLNFLEVDAALSFQGSSDQVIGNLNVDTAIKKKIENISNVKYIKKEKSEFSVDFGSGLYSTSFLNSFLKVSGSSLSNKQVTGSNFIYKYLSDPFIEVSNGSDFFTIDDWATDPAFSDLAYKNEIINLGYIDPFSFSGKDPFLKIKKASSSASASNYFFSVGEKNSDKNLFFDLNGESNRFVFSWNNLPTINTESFDTVSVNKSFLTYDVRTGTNLRNVFAYAVDLEKSVFSQYGQFQTENYEKYFYLPLLKIDPQIIYGWHSFLTKNSYICLQTEGCKPPLAIPGELCIDGLTGEYSFPAGGTGKTQLPPKGLQYDDWVKRLQDNFRSGEKTGGLGDLNSNLYEKGLSTGNFNSNSVFSGSSGVILFGDFFSGDRLVFKPYNLDNLGGYTGLYRSLYGVNPPYRELAGFSLQFKVDFSTPSELVSALQDNFSSYVDNPQRTGNLWYPGIGCNTGFGNTGFFEKVESPIAEVFEIDPEDFFNISGDSKTLDYWNGRIVGYRSNYFHTSGFSLSLQKNPRKMEVSTGQIDGFKYVLPDKISLHGSQDGVTWKLLDTRSNIRWTGVKETLREVPISYFDKDSVMSNNLSNLDGYEEGFIGDDIFSKTGFRFEDDFFVSGAPEDPHYQARPLFGMYKKTISQPKPYCEPKLLEEGQSVRYAGSGITCAEGGAGGPSGEKDGQGDETGKDPLMIASVRTGWVIDYDKLSVSQNELFNLNFNYFKVELEDFKSPVELYGLQPVSFFHVNKINFFSLVKDKPELKTNITCWDGGFYEILPSGYSPVNISGDFTADVRAVDSGVRKFEAALMSGRIVGKSAGDYVKFNRASGRLTSDTGYAIYSGPLYASGDFCTGVVDWFYDKETKIVNTIKQFCKNFPSGSGTYSGTYLRIKPDVVNRDLAFGRFLNPASVVNFETGIVFTGYFYNDNYVSGYTGYLKVPYLITGFTNSGYINFNQTFDGSSIGSGLRVEADPSGYSIASAWIKINENLLTEQDFVSLNGNDIFYNPNSSNAGPPDYFKDFNSLRDILTGDLYSGLFNSKFEVNDFDKSILIKSAVPGDSGNNIAFNFASVSGGISGFNGIKYSGLYLSGGKTFYQYITGTGNYLYNLSLSGYPITGFYYSNSGSGDIAGLVKTYQGERDFTGVWYLATGSSSFIQNLTFASGSGLMYSGAITGESLGLYPELLKIAVGYKDSFGLGGKDVALLSLFDKNYIYNGQNNNLITGSGVSIIIENY